MALFVGLQGSCILPISFTKKYLSHLTLFYPIVHCHTGGLTLSLSHRRTGLIDIGYIGFIGAISDIIYMVNMSETDYMGALNLLGFTWVHLGPLVCSQYGFGSLVFIWVHLAQLDSLGCTGVHWVQYTLMDYNEVWLFHKSNQERTEI